MCTTQVRGAHPELKVYDADSLEDVYLEQLAQPRGVAVLAFAFATVAVLAAAAGLFSVLTYAIGRRKREFGIRSALGASPAQIQTLVAIGVVVAWSLARAIASFQHGVSLNDPDTWLVIAITLELALGSGDRTSQRVTPIGPFPPASATRVDVTSAFGAEDGSGPDRRQDPRPCAPIQV